MNSQTTFPRLLLAAVLAVVFAAAAVAATDPRAEKERLRPADMQLAKRTTLRAADLAPGWQREPSSSNEDRTTCPGFDPDFSAFTITGKAESLFSRAGSLIASSVEVYATRRQAIGDLRTGAKPAAAQCIRRVFEQDFAKGTGGTARTTFSRMVRAPRIGERAVLYRLVGTLTVRGRRAPIYWDLYGFQRGRSLTGLFFAGFGGRIAGQTQLARAIAARMR